MFQDESVQVVKKAQKSKAKAIALRDKQDMEDRARAALVRINESLSVPLLAPMVDQGIHYFMSNYALGIDQPPLQSDQYHHHLATHGFHPIVATSMTALGLAGISNICMDVNFKREAMQWYSKALRMTNAALQSPSEVKADSTLLATMLLGVFEVTSNDRTLAGWSNHVEGSASLLRMRGKSQFRTAAGRRMYHQTVGLLTMNCMGRGEALPEYIHALNREVEKHEDRTDPANRFFHLHIDAIDFRAQIMNGQMTNLIQIIERALEIDGIAKRVFQDVEDWQYETVQTDTNTPGVFGNYYHIYPHSAAAQTWNWVRYNRIYLNDIIRNALILGFSITPPVLVGEKYTILLQECTQALYQMQADILASIPQHLHDTPKTSIPYSNNIPARPDTLMTRSSSDSDRTKLFWSNFRMQFSRNAYVTPASENERLPIVRVSGGYSSLWALYIAGAMPVASPESQEYVLKSFQRIGAEFGINQSKVLAGALRLKKQLDERGAQPFKIAPQYMPMSGEHVQDWPMDSSPHEYPGRVS